MGRILIGGERSKDILERLLAKEWCQATVYISEKINRIWELKPRKH